MKLVADTDILSIFARIRRLDVLNNLFSEILVPTSVLSELKQGDVNIASVSYEAIKFTREELKLKESSQTIRHQVLDNLKGFFSKNAGTKDVLSCRSCWKSVGSNHSCNSVSCIEPIERSDQSDEFFFGQSCLVYDR